MQAMETIRQGLFRVIGKALLALFLIPLLAWLFIHHAHSVWDREFIDRAAPQIEADTTMSPARKAELTALFKAVPPSASCAASDPALAAYRADVCAPYGRFWQFSWVERVVKFTVLLELALCISLAALGKMAFGDRDAQYRSLVLAWRTLSWSSALIVLAQSALLVWLSYWITAYFFHMYSIKLVGLVGIGAAAAAFMAVGQIFARIAQEMPVEGELIKEADAPALWARIRALAAQIGSSVPHRIVAGIDANFFVTEGGVVIDGRVFRGRTLYVSLPLLRVLDQREADAVLAHELAHFAGGDTRSSAAFGPRLAQFDRYCAGMGGASLTMVVFYLLVAYRTVLELALMRDSREREFLADRAAAKCVHPLPLMRALVKVSAYSSYRSRIENELFEKRERMEGQIGIAQRVAQGLQPFARSLQFQGLMEEASVPHPFDSHPKLQERMRNVKCVIAENEFGQVLSHPVQNSWASEIVSCESIEARLWAAYESHFAQAHERDLAYRYRPRNDAERDIVLKYFPPQVFRLTNGSEIGVHYEGLDMPDDTTLAWSEIKDLKYEDGIGGDVLTVELKEKALIGNKSTKAKLPGIKPQRGQLQAALGHYMHRHRVAHGQI